MTYVLPQSPPSELLVEFTLVHYEGPSIGWHVQLQIARSDDPKFSTPLTAFSQDTTNDLSGWYYRDDHDNAANGNWIDWPSGGVVADPDHLNTGSGFARALCILDPAEVRSRLRRGERLIVRARQSADGGNSWDNWISWPIEVG